VASPRVAMRARSMAANDNDNKNKHKKILERLLCQGAREKRQKSKTIFFLRRIPLLHRSVCTMSTQAPAARAPSAAAAPAAKRPTTSSVKKAATGGSVAKRYKKRRKKERKKKGRKEEGAKGGPRVVASHGFLAQRSRATGQEVFALLFFFFGLGSHLCSFTFGSSPSGRSFSRLQQELMSLMVCSSAVRRVENFKLMHDFSPGLVQMNTDKTVSAFPDTDNLFSWKGTIQGAPGTVGTPETQGCRLIRLLPHSPGVRGFDLQAQPVVSVQLPVLGADREVCHAVLPPQC
jgi:hypothetical protein